MNQNERIGHWKNEEQWPFKGGIFSSFTMIEIWDRVQSHQDSVKNIPAELMAQIQPLLASSPSGHYYNLVHGL